MITEVARLAIDPARADDFVAAVASCAPLFRAARGCRAMRLVREVETPGIYLLQVDWETLDDHVVHFRGSDAFARWRASAGPFFVAPPQVTHQEDVADHF